MAFDPTYASTITIPFFGDWLEDGDGANTNGGGMAGTVPVLTEAPPALCKAYDAGNAEYNNFNVTAAGTDYTANYQLISDSKNNNDATYFGDEIPFCEAAFDMSATVQTYTGDACVWEYWNGAWVALTISYDNTDTTAQDGNRSFQRDGAITFVPPADWASTTVDGAAGFWVRCRYSTGANVNVKGLTNSKEHQIVTAQVGWTPFPGHDLYIDGVRAINGNSTLHATRDVKFLLFNQTTGDHSGELTWAMGQRTASLAFGSPFVINSGDRVWALVTQDDGVADLTNVLLEAYTYTTS